jgi:hypothetical protein
VIVEGVGQMIVGEQQSRGKAGTLVFIPRDGKNRLTLHVFP